MRTEKTKIESREKLIEQIESNGFRRMTSRWTGEPSRYEWLDDRGSVWELCESMATLRPIEGLPETVVYPKTKIV